MRRNLEKQYGKQQIEAGRAGWRSAMTVRLAAAGMCAAMLSGCGSVRMTEEEIVIPASGGAENAGAAETGDSRPQEMADSVAAQVQAPERYQTEIKDGNVMVRADAAFEIPDVAGIKTKKVTARFFTQEDYDTVNAALFDGQKLWDRDYEAMEDTHGFTLPELYARIEKMEAEKADGVDGDAPYGDKKETLNEQIAALRELVENAERKGADKVMEPVIVEIPAIVEKDEAADGDWFSLSGLVTVKGTDYFIDLMNHMDEEWRWTQFFASKNSGSGNYMPYGYIVGSQEEAQQIRDVTQSAQIHPEEVMAQAAEALEQLAISDYVLQDGEYFASYIAGQDDVAVVDRIGYGVHAVRMVDGVPVRYTHQDGGSMQEDERVCWPYEELTFIYDEEGLDEFRWSSPCEITDLSADYVFLLPFSDIQNVFEKMIIKKMQDSFDEEGGASGVEIEIDQICLSYVRIREKNAIEGTLIPVWDFFGTQTYKNESGEVIYIQESGYDSILTVNAMDGTVVDRKLGY